MKILYKLVVDAGTLEGNQAPDYQIDSLFHGLSEEIGTDLVDFPQMSHMYQDFPGTVRLFSLYKLIPQDRRAAGVDRTDIINKIKTQYFDKVILAIHHTKNGVWDRVYDEAEFILKHYPSNKVAIVDGWDLPSVNNSIVKLCPYFKREVTDDIADKVYPIQFAIPESKLRPPLEKTKAFAHNVPVCFSWNHPHQSTYIYGSEAPYYEDYGHSYFAYTCKKGGWDCMRHAEILAAGALPWFTDIEDCPQLTLHKWPKNLLYYIKTFKGVDPGFVDKSMGVCDTRNIKIGGGSIDFDKFDKDNYCQTLEHMQEYARNHLTTRALAQRFLDTLESYL